jgi:hypothetical protein
MAAIFKAQALKKLRDQMASQPLATKQAAPPPAPAVTEPAPVDQMSLTGDTKKPKRFVTSGESRLRTAGR